MVAPEFHVVILAGYGNSLYPITDDNPSAGLPKALLPIGNRPMLSWLLNWLEVNGFADIWIIGHSRSGNRLSSYLSKQYAKADNTRIELFLLDDYAGPVDALLAIRDRLKRDVLVLPCDLIVNYLMPCIPPNLLSLASSSSNSNAQGIIHQAMNAAMAEGTLVMNVVMQRLLNSHRIHAPFVSVLAGTRRGQVQSSMPSGLSSAAAAAVSGNDLFAQMAALMTSSPTAMAAAFGSTAAGMGTVGAGSAAIGGVGAAAAAAGGSATASGSASSADSASSGSTIHDDHPLDYYALGDLDHFQQQPPLHSQQHAHAHPHRSNQEQSFDSNCYSDDSSSDISLGHGSQQSLLGQASQQGIYSLLAYTNEVILDNSTGMTLPYELLLGASGTKGNFIVRTDLVDCHCFLFARGILDVLARELPDAYSIRDDWIPWLARHQNRLRTALAHGVLLPNGHSEQSHHQHHRLATDCGSQTTSSSSSSPSTSTSPSPLTQSTCFGGMLSDGSSAGTGTGTATAASVSSSTMTSSLYNDSQISLPGMMHSSIRDHCIIAGSAAAAAAGPGCLLVDAVTVLDATLPGCQLDAFVFARCNTLASYADLNRRVRGRQAALLASHPKELISMTSASASASASVSSASAVMMPASVQIGSDCLVGEGSIFGEKCSIKRSTIGAHCRLGHGVKLNGCVLMDYAVVEDACRLDNVIVAWRGVVRERSVLKDCEVGCGARVEAQSNARNETFYNEELGRPNDDEDDDEDESDNESESEEGGDQDSDDEP